MAKTNAFFLEGNNGYSVLLCHPLAETPAMMLEFGKKLNKKGYTVSCPLLDGHGKSFFEMIDSDFEKWYENIETEFITLQNTTKVFVCGMSIGGTLAVKIAEEYTPQGVATINAPVIGFDVVSDVFGFKQKAEMDQEVTSKYRTHREIYFDNVVEIGQIENLKRITSPFFVLQGSLDASRYKTSSHMLMTYINSKTKQRKDYKASRHLILIEQEKKQAMKDIYSFLEENKETV
jgi:carboxylesterase